MDSIFKSCRVCFSDNCEKSVDDDDNLLELFQLCTGKTIGDTLPRLLCDNCIYDIHQFATFKKKCTESELYWETVRSKDQKKNEIANIDLKDETNSFQDYTDIDTAFLYPDINYDNAIIVKQNNKPIKTNKKYIKRKKKCTQQPCREVNKEDNHNCGLCKVTCLSNNDLNEHLANHFTKNNLTCETCKYLGRDFADMVTHRYNHEPSKLYSCFICKSKKGSLLLLQYHFRHIHLNKAGGWCDICGKTFQIFKSWRRHLLFHKRDKKLLVCDYCDKRYLYKYQIEEHIIYHLRKSQFVCETCGKGFNKKFNLQSHQRSIHSVSVPVKCDHCDKTYKNQDSLDAHMKKVAREKPYICELCSKGFSLPSQLRKHSFFHTGDKPHDCDVCGRKYKTKSSLKCHQLKHLGIYKHKCSKCVRSFTTSVQLRRHLMVHTGDGKFKCHHCAKSFSEKSRRDVHSAKHRDPAHVKKDVIGIKV